MARILDAFRGSNSADPPADSSNPSAPDIASIKSEARATSGTKRGRKTRTDDEITSYQAQADIDRLFADENWEQVAGLYFKARFAVTGWEGFLLSDKESRVLTTTMSTAMRVLLKIDPAYLALVVFSVNFGGVIASKEMAYKEIMKKQAQR